MTKDQAVNIIDSCCELIENGAYLGAETQQMLIEAVKSACDLPKKKEEINMTNEEAAEILRSHQLFDVSPVTNKAFNLAIAALEEQDRKHKNYSGLFDTED